MLGTEWTQVLCKSRELWVDSEKEIISKAPENWLCGCCAPSEGSREAPLSWLFPFSLKRKLEVWFDSAGGERVDWRGVVTSLSAYRGLVMPFSLFVLYFWGIEPLDPGPCLCQANSCTTESRTQHQVILLTAPQEDSSLPTLFKSLELLFSLCEGGGEPKF